MSADLAWVQKIIAVVERESPKTFFGSLQINVQGGGVSNINVNQSVKKEGTAR